MQLDYKNIKKVGLIAKIMPNLHENFAILREILAKKDIQILVEKSVAKELNLEGFELINLAKSCDFLISLGGDGTLISTCRQTAKISPFILGIHAGRLGFLTDITLLESRGFFADFFKGKFEVERPFMLEVKIYKKNGEIQDKIAINDAVISSAKVGASAHIEAILNGRYFNSYFGDGVIISTPIGSTAYNMSAGGAIIYPLAEVFSITPVCSHSLTQRPVVLTREFEVDFKTSSDALLVLDGQERFDMAKISFIRVRLSQNSARLIRHIKRDYFQILKEKLHWGYND